MARFNVFFLFLIVLTSCSSVKTREQLIDYLNNPDNGLIKTSQAGKVTVTARYHPIDLMIANELENTEGNKNKPDSIKALYAKYIYFDLILSANNKEITANAKSGAEYASLFRELNFGLGDKISLIDGKDTLAVENFIYTPTYGLSDHTDVLCVFRKKNDAFKNDIRFEFLGSTLGLSHISFTFRKKDLNNTPTLLK